MCNAQRYERSEARRYAALLPFRSAALGKRLALLHELVPKAVRVTIIVNPTDVANTESTLRDVPEAARTIGLQFQILNATTIGEIDAAFATLAHEGPGALFVSPDGFFTSRRVQFATLTARRRRFHSVNLWRLAG